MFYVKASVAQQYSERANHIKGLWFNPPAEDRQASADVDIVYAVLFLVNRSLDTLYCRYAPRIVPVHSLSALLL